VLKKIDDDLAWRGPGGGKQRYVLLTRDQAEYLRHAVIAVIRERDEILFHVEQHTALDGKINT
jgi:hypothetical protein